MNEVKWAALGLVIDVSRDWEWDWDTEYESPEHFLDDPVIVALFAERSFTIGETGGCAVKIVRQCHKVGTRSRSMGHRDSSPGTRLARPSDHELR